MPKAAIVFLKLFKIRMESKKNYIKVQSKSELLVPRHRLQLRYQGDTKAMLHCFSYYNLPKGKEKFLLYLCVFLQ